ncbi:MAG TPA: diacylglycerol kinase family protein [Bacteroidales bacterium]|nr:diacylglycerol kinase family protein [Bacteroidales bacterium]
MKKGPEWLVIVNPNAGNGNGGRDWGKISSLLHDAKISFAHRITESKGHAISYAKEGIAEGYRNLVAVGGDGTLNEVVNGIFLNNVCPATDITLASIPVGTGNDWGKMFGITPDYENAIKIIAEKKTMKHDIGRMHYYDENEQKTRYFINIAGMGFEAVVVNKTNFQKEHGKGGKLIYLYNLLTSLLAYKNTPAELTIDDETIKTVIFSVNIGNGKYCGGGMRQTPRALPDDGLLDVTIIKDIGKLEIIRKLKILYNGTILTHPRIDGYKCKTVRVTSPSPLYLEADGESLGNTPADFDLIPDALNIVYGTPLIR